MVLKFYLFQLFIFIQILFAQWEVRESGVTNYLHDVCFVDSLYGWAVGDSGTVITTADGGNTWTRQRNPVDTLDFRKVKFVDRYVGFVGGNCILIGPVRSDDAIILKTVDGGANWVECDLGQNEELYFYDMDFSDINNGWVLVNNVDPSGDWGGYLLSTQDGGIGWSTVLNVKRFYAHSIAFWEKYYGYLFTNDSFDGFSDSNVSYTEDGGLTWTQVGIIADDRIRNVSFHSKDTLWAIGNYTWKSEDAGITWDWFHPDVTDDRSFIPRDVYVFDSTRIWLIGYAEISYSDYSGVLISTDDCGENWLLELDIPHEGFNALEIEAQQHAWIVGGDGLILYRDLKYITSIVGKDNVAVSFELKQNYPNPFNPTTVISYQLPAVSEVNLSIYNLTGQRVATLVSEKQNTSLHQVEWDGSGFASGVYYYRLQTGKFQEIKKMVLLK